MTAVWEAIDKIRERLDKHETHLSEVQVKIEGLGEESASADEIAAALDRFDDRLDQLQRDMVGGSAVSSKPSFRSALERHEEWLGEMQLRIQNLESPGYDKPSGLDLKLGGLGSLGYDLMGGDKTGPEAPGSQPVTHGDPRTIAIGDLWKLIKRLDERVVYLLNLSDKLAAEKYELNLTLKAECERTSALRATFAKIYKVLEGNP